MLLIIAFSSTITCPAAYTYLLGNCYAIQESTSSWEQSEGECETQDGSLVSIFEYKSNRWIYEFARCEGYSGQPIWLGLEDQELLGNFQWIDKNDFTYRNWISGQPDNSGRCVVFSPNQQGAWDDVPCSNSGFGLCAVVRSNFTADPTIAPSALPTVVPSIVPTAIPTLSRLNSAQWYDCNRFSASATSSASSSSTPECVFHACHGDYVSVSTCSGHGNATCSGDTYIRVFNESGIQVLNNDDSCGKCSSGSFAVQQSGCSFFYIKEGCYSAK